MLDLPPAPIKRPVGNIDVSLEDRWLILGVTGTGKTTFTTELVKRLMRSYPGTPLHILDTKADGKDFLEWQSGLIESDEPPAPVKSGVQIWRPGLDNPDAYDAWFRKILHAPGPSITLIDEISSLSSGHSNDAPPWFQRLLKQGRSMEKCVINCTQEMAYNPRQIKTQTNHVVRFRMGLGYDAREANKYVKRLSDETEPHDKHGFYYARIDRQSPVAYYATYHDFF